MPPQADDERAPDRDDDLIGAVFDGRYRVVEHIATGGMAKVYRGLDVRLDRDVALKILRGHLGEDPDFVRRFEREARVAARLQHPHVVAVFDQGAEHGHLFIAMEYVEGRTLRQVLEAEGALTPRAALDLMSPVLAALGHAHRRGDLHRDIKPENVLIGEDGVVKVTDFGLTRAVTSQTVTSATGVLLGTVAYVSPEQIGRGVADERTDVYAAGLVLFELLTGEKAFGGDSPLNVAYQHVHEGAPALSSVVAGVPTALDELVAAATAMDPDDRPADAAAFLARLQATRDALSADQLDRHLVPVTGPGTSANPAGGGGSVGTVGATMAYPVDRGQRTARLPVTGPGASSSSSSATSPTAVATQTATGELPTAPRRRRWPWVLVVLAGLILAATVWAFTLGPLTPTPVPTLVGKKLAEADAALTAVGLSHRDTEVFSETVAKGAVVASDPKAGVTTWRFAPVALEVSKGPERYAVPAVAGVALTTAESQITAARLTVGSRDEAYDESVPTGSVVSCDPVAGTPLPPGGAVNLVVSKGRKPIAVTDWTGKPADQASKALTDAGLVVDASGHTTSETVAKGAVISQNPNGGTLFKGDKVTLVVSDGPPLVTVPDVVGQQVGPATATLEAAGFKVKVQKLLPGINFGTVQSTDPDAGSQIPKGSTIILKTV